MQAEAINPEAVNTQAEAVNTQVHAEAINPQAVNTQAQALHLQEQARSPDVLNPEARNPRTGVPEDPQSQVLAECAVGGLEA